MKFENKSVLLDRFVLFSVGSLAFSVSLGVALVSISCLLLVIACICVFISEQFLNRHSNLLNKSSCNLGNLVTVWAIIWGLIWIVISICWSIAPWHQVGLELMRSARILVIPLVVYLVRTPENALRVLQVWIFGQVFVIFSSYGLWLGIQEPWTTSNNAVEFFTPYSNTLDQPIMSSVTFAVLWFYRDHFSSLLTRVFNIKSKLVIQILFNSILAIFFINVCFLMIGRSGMLSMIIVITVVAWFSLSKQVKRFALFLPFVIFGLLYGTSSKFHDRILQIPNEIFEYQQGKIETSQAIRLEFWHRSIQAVGERPILGYGVGSWPQAYLIALKGEPGIKADSPHQQFFLWWVEEGTVGVLSLLAIYLGIFKDSFRLEDRAKYSLISVFCVLFFTSLMNCPLQGAGISEFFCLVIGSLLVFQIADSSG